jgi:hypothetical protein
MPYYRGRRRRRQYKKTPYRRRGKRYVRRGRRGRRTTIIRRRQGRSANYLNKAIENVMLKKLEKKICDTSIPETYFTNTGNSGTTPQNYRDLLSTVVEIDQGTAGSVNAGGAARIGDKITVRRMTCAFTVEAKLLATTATAVTSAIQPLYYPVRVYIVLDREANGSAASATNVLAELSTNPEFAFRTLTDRRRFKVIKMLKTIVRPGPITHHSYSGGASDAVFRQGAKRTLRWSRKMRIPINYATGQDQGDISKITNNNIFVFAVAEDLEPATYNITLTIKGKVRVRFTDA